MKKWLYAIALIMMVAVLAPTNLNAQKKKETRKERKERIGREIDEKCRNRNLYFAIKRLCPKNGVAQNVIYANDGYFAEFSNNTFTCNLPYIASTERTNQQAYSSNDNLYLYAENQKVSIMGGWQSNLECYGYQTTFWNNDKNSGPLATQVTITFQVFRSGEAIIMAQWPGMEPMSYMAEIIEKPAKTDD